MMRYVWFVCVFCMMAVGLWHCGNQTPEGSPLDTFCLTESDCASGRLCLRGICEIEDLKKPRPLMIQIDASIPDDFDNHDTKGPDRPAQKDSPKQHSGRFPDATPSENHIEANEVGDQTSGRPSDATPGQIPAPRRPPPKGDTGQDVDNPKQPGTPKCKKGETQPCYPEDKVGCSATPDELYRCIAPCQPGKRSCKDGQWGKCEGAVTPSKSGECVQKKDDKPCERPTGANGRCR